MKKHLLIMALAIFVIFPLNLLAQTSDDLDNYILRLKKDKTGALQETGYLSAGSDFLYGQEYLDTKNYSAAEWNFLNAVKKEKNNTFINYQLAFSLLMQNDEIKKQQADPYLEAAFQANPKLKERFKKDFPANYSTEKVTPDNRGNSTTNNNTITTGKNAGLNVYIKRLKDSRSAGGDETAMGSVGREALYGIDYYEDNNYQNAETSFSLALAKDPSSAYINYLMAVSMAAQGKSEAAKPYYNKAIAVDPLLVAAFNKDLAVAKLNWQKNVDAKQLKIPAAVKKSIGGPLVFGNYTCHKPVWNGPNKSPAYSHPYQGYFQLNANGTYRWQDNGETGKYKYDAKTGNVTWLSGEFKTSGVSSTQLQSNNDTVQMTLNFKDPVRWECSCKKK